jgi:hypothetical protein
LGVYGESHSRTLRPVIVESHEQLDDPDGYPEKNMYKKNPEFVKAREVRIFCYSLLINSYFFNNSSFLVIE